MEASTTTAVNRGGYWMGMPVCTCAIENTSINPFQSRIRTGIAGRSRWALGRVIGRSGLSAEGYSLSRHVDSGYVGEISVVMQNLSGKLYLASVGNP